VIASYAIGECDHYPDDELLTNMLDGVILHRLGYSVFCVLADVRAASSIWMLVFFRFLQDLVAAHCYRYRQRWFTSNSPKKKMGMATHCLHRSSSSATIGPTLGGFITKLLVAMDFYINYP